MTDYDHLRELAGKASEPMGDLGNPYEPGSAKVAGKWVYAQNGFQDAIDPQTMLALLDERDELDRAVDEQIDMRHVVEAERDAAVAKLAKVRSEVESYGVMTSRDAGEVVVSSIKDEVLAILDADAPAAEPSEPVGDSGTLATHKDSLTGPAPIEAGERECPQPCEHLSAEDARDGKTCPEHPCTCEAGEREVWESLTEQEQAACEWAVEWLGDPDESAVDYVETARSLIAAGFRRAPIEVTDEMVAAGMDAYAKASSIHDAIAAALAEMEKR